MAMWSAVGDDIFAANSARIGQVQYFLKHTVTFEVNGNKESMEHVSIGKNFIPEVIGMEPLQLFVLT